MTFAPLMENPTHDELLADAHVADCEECGQESIVRIVLIGPLQRVHGSLKRRGKRYCAKCFADASEQPLNSCFFRRRRPTNDITQRLESLADDIENKPPTQKQVISDLRMLARELESERQAF